jgi:hypothetical protein
MKYTRPLAVRRAIRAVMGDKVLISRIWIDDCEEEA